jgi:hypothetical protein
LVPLIIASCLMAISNISNAQLSSINRLGRAIGFSILGGLLTAGAVVAGWRLGGVVGVAYGFLCARIANVAQDLYAIRLLKAGGWLDIHTWKRMAAQGIVAAVFATPYLFLPKASYWLLIPAALHSGLVTAWLLRNPLRNSILYLFTRLPRIFCRPSLGNTNGHLNEK